MAKLSLKVVVAGRSYPLTVNEGEEEKVLKAAADINKAIKLLQDNYAVKDMQDLLAMTALQLAAKSEGKQNNAKSVQELESLELKLEGLAKDLDSLR